MSEALKEARDYRDSSESNLKEIVGGQGEMTITQDDKTMIIKTKDWQTYKAKGWVKKTNESLDLSATGATTASSTSQEIEEAADKSSAEYKAGLAAAEKGEKYDTNPHAPGRNRLNWSMGHNQFRADALRKAGKPNYGARGQFEETDIEGEELNEGRVMIAVDKKTKKKWQFSGGMTVKHDGKTYDTEGVSMQQVLELSSRQGDIKLGKKDVEAGFASGTFSVVNDGSVYQPWKNDFEPEGEQELSEAWNEKLSKKGLEQYRTMYKSLSNSGIDTKWIKALEKLYDDIVIGGMYSSRSAEREGILKIDGRTKYKNQNW